MHTPSNILPLPLLFYRQSDRDSPRSQPEQVVGFMTPDLWEADQGPGPSSTRNPPAHWCRKAIR